MSTRKAPRKTDAQRGPLGAWAYNTRTLLDVSGVDAAAAAGVTEPTLRKIEGGSNKSPARRVVWDLWQYLAKRGNDQGIPVEPPPAEWRGPVVRDEVPASARDDALAAAIDRQTAAMTAQAEAFTKLAASIDRAATGVVSTVQGYDARTTDLLRTLGELAVATRAAAAPRLRSGYRRNPARGTHGR